LELKVLKGSLWTIGSKGLIVELKGLKGSLWIEGSKGLTVD